MRRRLTISVVAHVVAGAIAIGGAGGAAASSYDLSGYWSDGAGTSLTLQQSGTSLTWKGGPDSRAWIQEFTGTLEGSSFSGTFEQDAPGVTPQRYHGRMTADVLDHCHFRFTAIVQAGMPTVTGIVFTKTPCGTTAVSAPTKSTGATPKPHLFTRGDLRRNKAYRTFFGLSDPRVGDWGRAISQLCVGLVQSAVTYPGVSRAGDVPGQTTFGQHSASVFGNSDFHDLLDSSLPASDLSGNVFVEATKLFEPRLRNLIATSSGHLTPADVLGFALQATHGSYPLAVLTTLNLLKNVTFVGRDAAVQASHLVAAHPSSDAAIAKENELYQKQIDILTIQDQVVGKLASLRENPLLAQDKMGPWYHAFTILTVSALSPLPIPRGNATAFWEHFRKAIGAFGTSEAPFNPEKATLDFCFAQSADATSLLNLSRH